MRPATSYRNSSAVILSLLFALAGVSDPTLSMPGVVPVFLRRSAQSLRVTSGSPPHPDEAGGPEKCSRINCES